MSLDSRETSAVSQSKSYTLAVASPHRPPRFSGLPAIFYGPVRLRSSERSPYERSVEMLLRADRRATNGF